MESESLVGTMIRFIRTPAVAHIARRAGLDFIMVDMEGGAYTYETLTDLAASSAAAGLDLLVRVPELSRGNVARALDCGARGVMAPNIESPGQAGQLAQYSKYPPVGSRGLSALGASTGYGKPPDLVSHLREQNERVLAIAQIESAAGVRNASRIAEVPGLDVLLVGPNDLALSLGCPGQLDSPAMREAIQTVALAAKQGGKVFGMHGDPALIQGWKAAGLRLLMSSTDIGLLAGAMRGVGEKLRSPA